MQITVLSVTVENKGKYNIADTAYKDDQGKVAGKKIFSFGAAEKAYKVLTDPTSVGKTFEVTSVKNDKGYWDWTNLTATTPGAAPASSSTPVGRATSGSTYASAEERAKTQVYIVKQSSLSNAINALNVGAKAPVDPALIIKTAQAFADWVLAEKSLSLLDTPNDLPFGDDEVA